MFARCCLVLLCLVASASAFVPSAFLGGAQLSAARTAQSQVPCMLFGGGGNKAGDEKGGGGGGLNMGSMMESLKKANEIGRKSKEMQDELEKMRLEGKSSNGKAKVTMTGQQIPVGCEIDESLLSEGKEAVQTAVLEAMTEAHKESLMVMGKKMAELYQGMGLPVGNPGQQ
ncbi:nucleoid-associated protein YbaB family [Tribonema minus]|uniref:Nucleoid-associated protein YbaB family n=1 Tax=Tribonema minus TaxID=303371 RepID=A0A835YMC5_9STRA|nr:nucleoid-associated protein YbaB family [Tribonema minus]